MVPRRSLALAALVLLLCVPASAQRRRSMRSPAAAPVNGGGQCHTFGLVAAGRKATYHTVAPGGNVDFTITWIFDTLTQTKTTQKVTTAQGTADVETLLDGEVFGQLRGLKHLNVKGSQSVPVLGTITTTVDINFVPSLTQGPAAGWCPGYTWTVPPVTETIVTSTPQGQTQNIVTTVGSTGEVLAVNEPLSVPGGNFNTVKYRGVLVNGTTVQTAITWVSKELNIVVRQDTVEGNTVTSTTTLTSYQ
jgi:hypothetical protein